MNNKANKFSPEVRERAVRLVQECRANYSSLWATCESIVSVCPSHLGRGKRPTPLLNSRRSLPAVRQQLPNLAGLVPRNRVNTSFRYANGSCLLSLADWIRLITAAARWPAGRLTGNSQLLQPTAMGRIWLSIQLLSTGSFPSAAKRVSAAQRLRL